MNKDVYLDYHNALQYSSVELAKIANHCFENFIVPFTIDDSSFAARAGAEDISLNDSLIVTHQNKPVALALISRRGQHCRVAAFAICQTMRGRGLGKRLMQRVVTEALQRGDKRLSLEVFEGNESAVTLYHSVGMRICRTLTGYQSPVVMGENAVELQQIDPLTVSYLLIAEGATNMPWQVSPESLYKLPNSQAFTFDHKAYAVVISDIKHSWLRMVYVPPQYRGHGYARSLLSALQIRLAPQLLTTEIFVPEVCTPVFIRLGWQQNPLRQFEMDMLLNS